MLVCRNKLYFLRNLFRHKSVVYLKKMSKNVQLKSQQVHKLLEYLISRSLKISSKYGYSVTFAGVGEGPSGTEQLGHCSQIGVFIKSQEQNGK